MSLSISTRPSITFEAQPARWNAVRNPIIYRLIRKDYIVNQVNFDATKAQLQINGVDVSAQFGVGDMVYFESTVPGYGVTKAVLTSVFSGGNTLVTIDQGYLHPVGGWVNTIETKLLYGAEIEVYDDDNNLLNTYPFKYSATSDGRIVADISAVLRANLIADFDGDLTGTTDTFDDTNVYKKFYIKYQAVWLGGGESQQDDVANQFFAVLAAMQIPAPNGGNMAIYSVPFIEFLTKMDTLVMWRGYPTLLGAIISEDVAEEIYISDTVYSSDHANYSGKVVSFDLNVVITDQTMSETEMAVYLLSFPAISEQITVELRDACENAVMLLGRNSLGGPLQWLFDENQEYTFDYGNGVKAKRMRLFADDLNLNQWESLQDFFTLGEVYKNNITELTSSVIKTATRTDNQVYVVDANGNKIGVIVIPRQPSTETRQVKHVFEIEIEFPEQF